MSVRTDGPTHAPVERSGSLRAAYTLSISVGVLMVAASATGLLVDRLYPDGDWVRQAFRGADLVTLVLAAPVLIVSVIAAARGSRIAQVVWMGMLGYAIYNYAYAVFGAEFSDAFLAHIAILSMSVFALFCAIPNLDVQIDGRTRAWRGMRWIGAFLVLVGTIQGALWAFLVIRFAFTGQILHDIPARGQHLVFALDLSLLVPTLVVSGILMFRRTAAGFFMGSAVAVFGAVYQVNLMVAGLFQAEAGVAGVKAFPLEGVVLTSGFLIVTTLLLRAQRRSRDSATPVAEPRTPSRTGTSRIKEVVG